MSSPISADRPVWGLAGFILGAIALALVVMHVSAMFAEPGPSAATKIVEFAAEIRNAAKRGLSGAPQPEPAAVEVSLFAYVMLAAPVLAGLAVIAGGIGLFRQEAPHLPWLAVTFGASAFVMQFAIWLAMVIAGICLMVAIISNLDQILGG